MILVAGGDSMVWGSELADSPHGGPGGHSQKTFPALLADDANIHYQCCAYPGNANNAISRSIITQIEQDPQPKIVLVMWTFTQRIEVRFSHLKNNLPTSSWYSINSRHCDDKFRFNSGLIDPPQIREFARSFFKFTGNSEYVEQYNCLKEILFLQLYLKDKNIPYLFMTTNNETFKHDNYKRHEKDPDLSGLYQQIDWDSWFFFPSGTHTNETQTPRGFYQWAIENKYSIGPEGHPLEQAHRDAALLIKEKFNELVKKSI
jgi:hypothetical protein